MASPEGSIGPEYVASLREKWGLGETSSVRADLTAILLENQDRHFNRLVEETNAIGVGDWRQSLSTSLRSQLSTHPLPELCSMQPMTGPIGVIYFYRHRTSGVVDGVPEITLDFAHLDVRAESRMCKSLFGSHAGDDVMEMMVEELLTEVSRGILGTMLNCVTVSNGILEVEDGADLKEELTRASHTVHRRSQRAPANKIIGNEVMLTRLGVSVPISNGQVQRVCVLDEGGAEKTVYLDPLFPKGQLMAWYQGDSPYDTGVIYSPYVVVEITPNFLDPSDNTLRRALHIRHKISLVRPEFVALIRTPEAEPLHALKNVDLSKPVEG